MPSEYQIPKTSRFSRFHFGLLVDWISSPYHLDLISGVEAFAAENNINLFCFETGRFKSPYDWEKNKNLLFDFISRDYFDGLLVPGHSLSVFSGPQHLEKQLKHHKDIPIVALGDSLQCFPSICVDNTAGMKALVDHMITGHGYRKIAFIKGPKNNPESDCRFETFKEILSSHSIAIDQKMIVEGSFIRSSGKEAVKTLLDDRKIKPEAIVAANDAMALGVIEELLLRRVRIPDDIAVSGFDNTPNSCTQLLTTVNQPLYQQGWMAASCLYSIISGKPYEEKVTLSSSLLIRESCGCKGPEVVGEFKKHETITDQYLPFSDTLQESLDSLGEELVTATDTFKQLSAIAKRFPGFGINDFYLSFFNQPLKPLTTSSLALSLVDGKKRLTDDQPVLFQTRQIIPDQIYPKNRRVSYIVQALFFGHDRIGFMVSNYGIREPRLYDLLRQKLSTALKVSRLIEEMLQQTSELEETIRQRTAELTAANELLSKEMSIREQFQESLIKSENHYKEMVTHLPTIIFETNLAMEILFINQAGLELFPQKRSRSKTIPVIHERLHKEDKKRFSDYCAKVLQGKPAGYTEFRFTKPDESIVTLICGALPILKDNMIEGIRWSALDLKPLLSSMILPEDSFYSRYRFSPREKEVFLLMLQGFKTREIAKKLFITESTVKNHIGSIYEEIGVKNKSEFFSALKNFQINQFGYESYIFSLLSNLVKD